jgi:hypothetical protein
MIFFAAALFCAFGIGFAWVMTRAKTGFWNHAWPSVTGTMTENHAQKYIQAELEAEESQEWDESAVPAHEVSFEYSVDGKRYTSQTIAIGSYPYEYEEIESLFPVGKQVEVFYNPKANAQACLKTRAMSESVAGLFVCFIFVMVGLGVIVAQFI